MSAFGGKADIGRPLHRVTKRTLRAYTEPLPVRWFEPAMMNQSDGFMSGWI
jgi:tRNA(Ile)-lysidine synthase TilS/MesJ